MKGDSLNGREGLVDVGDLNEGLGIKERLGERWIMN